jgi:hypothetical protein
MIGHILGENVAKKLIDKNELVAKLPIDEEKLHGDEPMTLDQMSLARSLLKLAEINEDRVYQLCRSVAERLLDRVPEPDEIDLFEVDTGDEKESN